MILILVRQNFIGGKHPSSIDLRLVTPEQESHTALPRVAVNQASLFFSKVGCFDPSVAASHSS